MIRPALALALAACSANHIEGEIDGEPIDGARGAVYEEVGDSILIFVTSYAQPCEVIDAFAEAAEDADDCEEYCEDLLAAADEHGFDPRDQWELGILVYDDDAGEFDFDEFDATFSFLRGANLADQDTCEEACEDGETFGDGDDRYYAEDGDITLDDEDDGELPGEFLIEFDDSDELEGSFRAESCDFPDGSTSSYGYSGYGGYY